MQLFLKRQIEELLQDKLRAQPPSTAIQIWLDDNDQLRVRELSVLADVYQKDDAGRAVNQRALLTHVQDRLSVFTEDDIAELMDLMDNRRAREADFQRFFVAHSRLVAAAFNLQDVHPHVFLDNRDRDLIPDFILTDPVLQRAAVVELKLPRQLLIRRQANRDRFASAVMEARAQLLRYREWFRDENNRKALRAKVGMEIYEPKMGVIIGRNAAFLGDVDRQHLSTNTPDVEIVTFDDLVNLAKRRKWIIESS
jgi:hypothetical protein